MTINEFVERLEKIPTKPRRKQIKCFVGADRQKVYDLLELGSNATEEQLLGIWRA